MIYLVEDNDVVRDSIASMLKEIANVKVAGVASTEAEATEWLLGHPDGWQMAVVDLFLLQGSGLGILTRCANRKPSQKVVVLTNYATPDIRRRALALGADAVFDKTNELDKFLGYCTASRISAI
ncbi:MAG: response regulator [Polaromonas sp.]|nr:response regulator [Polaromonas sp.]